MKIEFRRLLEAYVFHDRLQRCQSVVPVRSLLSVREDCITVLEQMLKKPLDEWKKDPDIGRCSDFLDHLRQKGCSSVAQPTHKFDHLLVGAAKISEKFAEVLHILAALSPTSRVQMLPLLPVHKMLVEQVIAKDRPPKAQEAPAYAPPGWAVDTGTRSVIPELPEGYVKRFTEEEAGQVSLCTTICNNILTVAEERRSYRSLDYHSIGAQFTGLYGVPGGGKTMAAAEVARCKESNKYFPGGVYWVNVGPHATTAEVALEFVRQVAGVRWDTSQVQDPKILYKYLSNLPEIFPETNALVVFDDVRNEAQIGCTVNIFQLIPKSKFRFLVTTRYESVLKAHCIPSIPVDRFTKDRALEMLFRGSDPSAVELEAATTLVEECGHLPVVLASVAAVAAEGMKLEKFAEQFRAALNSEQVDPFGVDSDAARTPHSPLSESNERNASTRSPSQSMSVPANTPRRSSNDEGNANNRRMPIYSKEDFNLDDIDDNPWDDGASSEAGSFERSLPSESFLLSLEHAKSHVAALQVCVDQLDDRTTDEMYGRLGLFPSDLAIPIEALAGLWGGGTLGTMEAIDMLHKRCLLARIATTTGDARAVRLHGLQHAFVRRMWLRSRATRAPTDDTEEPIKEVVAVLQTAMFHLNRDGPNRLANLGRLLRLFAKQMHHLTKEAVSSALAGCGLDVRAVGLRGQTLCHAAAHADCGKAIEYLFDLGANVKAVDVDGKTPMHSAAIGGAGEVFEVLRTFGADISAKDSNGNTPLRTAALSGREKSIVSLQALGADVDTPDSFGVTAMHAVARKGRVDLVKVLHRFGSDKNVTDHSGGTPLHGAAERGQMEVADFLINELDADMAAVDKIGGSVMHAAARGGHDKMIRRLFELGADASAKDHTGATPLHIAARAGDTAVVKELGAIGVKIDVKDRHGVTPSKAAAEAGHKHTLDALHLLGAEALHSVKVAEKEDDAPKSEPPPWKLRFFVHDVLDVQRGLVRVQDPARLIEILEALEYIHDRGLITLRMLRDSHDLSDVRVYLHLNEDPKHHVCELRLAYAGLLDVQSKRIFKETMRKKMWASYALKVAMQTFPEAVSEIQVRLLQGVLLDSILADMPREDPPTPKETSAENKEQKSQPKSESEKELIALEEDENSSEAFGMPVIWDRIPYALETKLWNMLRFVSEEDGGSGEQDDTPSVIDVVATVLQVCKHLDPAQKESIAETCCDAMIDCGVGRAVVLRDSPDFTLPGRLLERFASRAAGVLRCHLGDLQNQTENYAEMFRCVSPKVVITTDAMRRAEHAAASQLGYRMTIRVMNWVARARRRLRQKFKVEYMEHTLNDTPHGVLPMRSALFRQLSAPVYNGRSNKQNQSLDILRRLQFDDPSRAGTLALYFFAGKRHDEKGLPRGQIRQVYVEKSVPLSRIENMGAHGHKLKRGTEVLVICRRMNFLTKTWEPDHQWGTVVGKSQGKKHTYDIEFQPFTFIRGEVIRGPKKRVCPCAVSGPDPDNGRYDVWYDKMQLIWNPAEFKEEVTEEKDEPMVYVCGRGARVVVPCDGVDGKEKCCATVVDLVLKGKKLLYALRVDNTTKLLHMDLRPDNATPAIVPILMAGQRIMLLRSPLPTEETTTAEEATLETKQSRLRKLSTTSLLYEEQQAERGGEWVDATVQEFFGRKHGSRHRVVVNGPFEEETIEVDLNPFNHTPQAFQSVEEFFELKTFFRDHLRETKSHVVDAITGRRLEVGTDCVKIRLVENTRGQKNEEYTTTDMESLADCLSKSCPNRSQGQFSMQPVLLRAAAGTGKTWAVQQLEYKLVNETSFEGLPLVIPGQELTTMMHKIKEEDAKPGDGRELIMRFIQSFVEEHFKDDPQREQITSMLLQCLRLHALTIILDGLDEALEQKEMLQLLFAEDLVPKRYRYVVTSRPGGVDVGRFVNSFVIRDLSPLSDEQVHFALKKQIEKNNEFFHHLLAFRQLRKEQDELFYNELATKSTVRRTLENLGNQLDRFRLDSDPSKFDPEMRQRNVGGARLLKVVENGAFKSNSIVRMTEQLTPKFGALDDVITDGGVPDGMELEEAVRQIDVELFGADDETCSRAQKTIFRVAKRLAAYTRRMRRDKKRGKVGMTAKEMWTTVATHTDELLHVAETFQTHFKKGIATAAGENLVDCIHIAPLKDPVRIYEKAYDDYADRFKDVDDTIPIACIVDVLRCSIVVDKSSDVITVLEKMQQSVSFDLDGKSYTLELIRAKNKFSVKFLTPSHFRNILLNVRLRVNGTTEAVFGEVQLKIQSILDLLGKFDSHAHYEYFRSIFAGRVENLDPLLNIFFDFIDKVCVVPVLMSLLIVIMNSPHESSNDGAVDALPLNRYQLYDMAISAVLKNACPEGSINWKLAKKVLSKIAFRKMLSKKKSTDEDPSAVSEQHEGDRTAQKSHVSSMTDGDNNAGDSGENDGDSGRGENLRVFSEAEVRSVLTDNEERATWRSLVRAAEQNNIPLIKVLEQSRVSGQYQFKHLSFQEFLAAAEVIHDFHPVEKNGKRPEERSWDEACDRIENTPAKGQRNFWSFLVEKYFYLEKIEIGMDDIKSSVQKYAKNDEPRAMSALVSESPFPPAGDVNLDDCDWITSEDLKAWAKAGSKVECLSLRNLTKIDDAGVQRLAATLRDITKIHLSGCSDITDGVLEDLGRQCDGLLEVDLGNMPSIKSEEKILAFLKDLKNLEKLNLHGTKLSFQSFFDEALSILPQLKEVDFGKCLVVEDKLSKSDSLALTLANKLVQSCTNLTSLNLEECAGGNGALVQLANLTKLTSINVKKWNIDTNGIRTFLKMRQKLNADPLTRIVIADTQVTGTGTSMIFAVCEDLEYYDISGLELGKISLSRLQKKQAHLHTLLLRNSIVKGTNGTLDTIVPALTTLDVSYCKWVRDTFLIRMLTKCTELQVDKLKIDHTGIGDASLQVLGERFGDLEAIDLRGCDRITDEGLAALAKLCPKLEPSSVQSSAKGVHFLCHFAAARPDLCKVDVLSVFDGHRCNYPAPQVNRPQLLRSASQIWEAPKRQRARLLSADISSKRQTYARRQSSPHAPRKTYGVIRKCPLVCSEPFVTLAKDFETDPVMVGLAFLTVRHPDLMAIDCNCCIQVTEKHLVFLAKKCPNLSTRGTKARGRAMGSKFLRQIVQTQMSSIRDISMRGCPIVNEDLEVIARFCPKLACIELRECYNIQNDNGLVLLALNCLELAPNQTFSYQKGKKYLLALAKAYPDGEIKGNTIDLRDCPKVDDRTLAAFVKAGRNFHPDKIVSPAKGKAFVRAVAKTHPDLEHLSLCASPRPVQVFESLHPRVTDSMTTEIAIAWADMLSITFDPRSDLKACEIDGVKHYINAGTVQDDVRSKRYIPGLGVPPLSLPRKGGSLRFEGRGPWGWRCIVTDTPNRHVSFFMHTLTHLSSIIELCRFSFLKKNVHGFLRIGLAVSSLLV